MKWIPMKHQHAAMKFLWQHLRCALFMGTGLGKTSTVLTMIRFFLGHVSGYEAQVKKVLVVAPKRVTTTVWPAEVAKWDHLASLDVMVIEGPPASREQRLKANAPIHAINYELLPWLIAHYGKRWPYDMVVFDESTKMKSNTAKRFKAMKKVIKSVKRVVLLTGTPAPNGLLDLWSQIFLLDQGERLGTSMTRYKDAFFESDYMGWSWTPYPWTQARIQELLADICLTLKTEDYADLEPLVMNQITVPLPPARTKEYRELEKEMYLALGDQEVEAFNAAALTNKCRQYANGAVYVGEGQERTWSRVHDLKLEVLDDIIEEAAGAPVLVAYEYQSDLERIMARYPKLAQKLGTNPQTIADWNAGKIPLLLAHPLSCGHGLNLQGAGQHRNTILVWFGLPWSLESYQQMNARLHRTGQTERVFVHHIVTEDTVDEQVLEALESKRSVQDVLLDAMKLREAA